MITKASLIRIVVFAIIGYVFLLWVGETNGVSIFKKQPIVWGIYGFLVLFHIAAELCVAALAGILFKSLDKEHQERYLKQTATQKSKEEQWITAKYKALVGGKAIEEEHEIILDHNYDGIKELDNDLPPWWKYSFYLTIIFAIIYLIRFEVFNDYNQTEEYNTAVAQAKIEIAAWKKTAKNLVDANTVTLLTDVSDLKAGKNIYTTNCVACHKADGGGGIGPNLTDKHWILGGSIKNVFTTISEGGRDGKGMISWKSDLKPLEMAQVASYVLTFQGTTPAEPKAPEGEIYEAETTNSSATQTNSKNTEVTKNTTVIDSINSTERK